MNDAAEVITRIAKQLEMQATYLVDVSGGVMALAHALANQPNVDRSRLAEDVATALRLGGTNVDEPSQYIATLLQAVRTPHESSLQYSLGAKLLRAEALGSDSPPQRP